ncbi:kinase-like domain-containing protein [Nemania sp. NC0429]|nr:kinase-like domain-containing protein [Nemania sp. NC0429]
MSSNPASGTLPSPPPFATTALPSLRPARVFPYADGQLVLPHEDVDKYTAGGFHPVNLGDTFQAGRYTVRHKLGYGGSSTAWLAYDNDARRWVSIKVKSAAVSTDDLHQDREISNLNQLERHYIESAYREPAPFARLLDCFHHTGPNGTHNCLVTELLGPSISDIMECYESWEQTFRPDTILRASCQLLEALNFFHQGGFAHGDVSNNNVAFTCQFDDEEDLFHATGDPVTADYTCEQTPWSPKLPKHLVGCTIWPGWYELDEEDLRLIDMGDTFPVRDTVAKLAQPLDVRSPETFFIGSFDHQHDLWRAGCVIYSLYYQKKPFEPGYGTEVFFILKLIEKLGPLPESWSARWEDLKSQCNYFEQYESRFSPEPIIQSFEPRRNEIVSRCNDQNRDYCYKKDEFTEHDYEALGSLFWVIQGLLQFEPDKRILIQDAVSHIRSKWTDHRRQSKFGGSEREQGVDSIEESEM